MRDRDAWDVKIPYASEQGTHILMVTDTNLVRQGLGQTTFSSNITLQVMFHHALKYLKLGFESELEICNIIKPCKKYVISLSQLTLASSVCVPQLKVRINFIRTRSIYRKIF